ncbi:hypothetical protein C8A05DRAFT_35070, partial [Staphylotrichum tortipilum]
MEGSLNKLDDTPEHTPWESSKEVSKAVSEASGEKEKSEKKPHEKLPDERSEKSSKSPKKSLKVPKPEEEEGPQDTSSEKSSPKSQGEKPQNEPPEKPSKPSEISSSESHEKHTQERQTQEKQTQDKPQNASSPSDSGSDSSPPNSRDEKPQDKSSNHPPPKAKHPSSNDSSSSSSSWFTNPRLPSYPLHKRPPKFHTFYPAESEFIDFSTSAHIQPAGKGTIPDSEYLAQYYVGADEPNPRGPVGSKLYKPAQLAEMARDMRLPAWREPRRWAGAVWAWLAGWVCCFWHTGDRAVWQGVPERFPRRRLEGWREVWDAWVLFVVL